MAMLCCLVLTLHLNQKLCLNAAGSFTLILIPGTTQRVHLVDEDDGGFVLASQVKEVLHQPGQVGEMGRKKGILVILFKY